MSTLKCEVKLLLEKYIKKKNQFDEKVDFSLF